MKVSACQVNVKSQSELDIGGRETCFEFEWKYAIFPQVKNKYLKAVKNKSDDIFCNCLEL